jgi:hypothetical protein
MLYFYTQIKKQLKAMALELTGKVRQVLAEQSGTGKNGQWARQDIIVETQEQFPKKVCFSAWNDKIGMLKALKPDDLVKVSFNIESREFNGRWYTDLRMWKIESEGQGTTAQSFPPVAPPDDLQPLSGSEQGDEPNDLPF